MANPVEDWKAEKHGFEVWPDVERHAAAGTPMKDIDSADLERMKWYGYFYRKRDAPGSYMNRIRDDSVRNTSTQRRLFEDGRFYHADGRARFLFEDPRPLPELPTAHYPLLLLTGRGSASQWHTQTRTAKSDVLRKLYPERVFVELNPADARPLGIVHDDWVFVESQRGRVRARAFLTHAVKPGIVFIPMHYDATNQLTHAAFDPYSQQPAYKACAVRVEKAVH